MATYEKLEKKLPTIVRAELANASYMHRQAFAEEYSRRRKHTGTAYIFWIFLSCHRWYLGRPGTTLLQWLLIFCGIGLIWWFIDFFLIPGLVFERNNDLARTILAEIFMTRGRTDPMHMQNSPTIINLGGQSHSDRPGIE